MPDTPERPPPVSFNGGGDPLAAVQALLVANSFLKAEVERLSEAISRGYVRGHLNNDIGCRRRKLPLR